MTQPTPQQSPFTPAVNGSEAFDALLTGEHLRAVRELVVLQAAYRNKVLECETLKQQLSAAQMELAKQPPPVEEPEQAMAMSVPPADVHMNGGGPDAGPGPTAS